MNALYLARWQFALTTIFHFLFVPLTIGLGLMVAVMQTIGYLRKDESWTKLSQFFGQLFLINMAVGVVTGIVLEFQFGMNWSAYSIFVGNIFGAPLAIEGLLAFFLESTFVGLWIFGRNRLSPRVHLATIWVVSAGTMLSAFFILAANAWMQHPVGYTVVHGRAVLTDFWAVLGNSTLWASFFHTLTAAFATAALAVLGVAAWHLLKGRDSGAFLRAAKFSIAFCLVSVLVTSVAGDIQARLMESQQPMKMAATEVVENTTNGASFSILTIGNLEGKPIFQIRIPHLLSLIADLSWDGQVKGINQIQAAESAKYGAAGYTPVLWVTYWTFRIMVGLGILMILYTAWGVVLSRRKKLEQSPWFLRIGLFSVLMPLGANTSGWIFTEMGRQPWVVYGLMRTGTAVSPGVTGADVLTTLIAFCLIYTVLGVVDVMLMLRFSRRDLDQPAHGGGEAGVESGLELIY